MRQEYVTVAYRALDVGLMGETVYLYILRDLKREGHANATAVENGMRSRQANWARQRYPYVPASPYY